MTKVSFDSGASAWDRVSARISASYVPTLVAAAQIAAGQRVLDVATGPALSAVKAAALVGSSGLVLATDISLPMLERAKSYVDGLPVRLVAMDAHALACHDATFDAVICHLGLMFFPDVARALLEFRRVLRPAGGVAVSVTTTPQRTIYGRVFETAQRYAPSGRNAMGWNVTLGDPQALETLLFGADFRDVFVTREIRRFPFESLEDYWARMEAGGGLSGATYLALSPEDRRAVRDEVRRGLLPPQSDGPFSVEMEVLVGEGRR